MNKDLSFKGLLIKYRAKGRRKKTPSINIPAGTIKSCYVLKNQWYKQIQLCKKKKNNLRFQKQIKKSYKMCGIKWYQRSRHHDLWDTIKVVIIIEKLFTTKNKFAKHLTRNWKIKERTSDSAMLINQWLTHHHQKGLRWEQMQRLTVKH